MARFPPRITSSSAQPDLDQPALFFPASFQKINGMP
jgi:hypothetical protein